MKHMCEYPYQLTEVSGAPKTAGEAQRRSHFAKNNFLTNDDVIRGDRHLKSGFLYRAELSLGTSDRIFDVRLSLNHQ